MARFVRVRGTIPQRAVPGEEAEDVTNIRVDVDVDAAETGSGARRLPAEAEPYTMEPQTAQLSSAPRTLQDKLASSDENTLDIPPSTNHPQAQPAEEEPSTLEPKMSVRSIDGASVDRMREALADEETLTSKSIVTALEIAARESVVAWEEAKNLEEDSSVTVKPRPAHGQVETSPTAFTPVTLTAKRAPTMIDGAPPPAPSQDFDLAPTDLALRPGTQAPALPEGIVPPTRDTLAESTERRMPPILLTPSEPITVPTSSAVPLPPIVFQPPRPAAGAAPALEAKTAEDEPFGRSDPPPPPTEAMATDDSVSFVSVDAPKTAKMPDPPPMREHKATLPMVPRPAAPPLAFAETAPMSSSSMPARFPDVRPGSAPSGSHLVSPSLVASPSAPPPSAREQEPPRGRGKVVAIILVLLVASGGASAFVVWKSGRWPGASPPAPSASVAAPVESAAAAPTASVSVVAPASASATPTASAKPPTPTPSSSTKRRPRHWQPRPGQKGFDPNGI